LELEEYNLIVNKILPGSYLSDSISGYKLRLKFSHLDYSGLEDMHEYSSMPEFFEHLPGRSPSKNVQETRNYLDVLKHREENGYHGGHSKYWFIKLKSTDKVIGTFGLVGVDFEKKIAEYGKGLSPKYWGKGLIFEALWVVTDYCFNRLGIEKIITSTDINNHSNINLMQTIGSKIIEENRVETFNGKSVTKTILMLDKNTATFDRCLGFAKLGESNDV